jgi:hypothetical protein
MSCLLPKQRRPPVNQLQPRAFVAIFNGKLQRSLVPVEENKESERKVSIEKVNRVPFIKKVKNRASQKKDN